MSFFIQNARLFAGMLECFGQPCQKQPSTKMARRCWRKTKSGTTEKNFQRPTINFES